MLWGYLYDLWNNVLIPVRNVGPVGIIRFCMKIHDGSYELKINGKYIFASLVHR